MGKKQNHVTWMKIVPLHIKKQLVFTKTLPNMSKQQLILRIGKAIAKSKKQNGYWPNDGPNRWKNNA